MVDLACGRSSSGFTLDHDGAELGRIELPVAGAHNARNATAAVVDRRSSSACRSRPPGPRWPASPAWPVASSSAARSAGVTFIDDYAHLPSEVAAALSAARAGDWGRVVCVFQPHRYSRTAALWPDFADAFGDADLLVVTDIYPAGEAPRPGVTGKLVVDAVLDAHPWRRVA